MPPSGPPSPHYRFGPFELDIDARKLLENCKPVHIAEQPLRVLGLLVARAGELITRAQLQAELWPEGTFVDFERSINSAVRRLRRALHDDHNPPLYIATVTGHGYRFIAAVERLPAAVLTPPAGSAAPPRPRSRWRQAAMVAAGMALALGAAGWTWMRLGPQPRVLAIRALTTDGGMDLPARPVSDGTLLYYLDRDGGHWDLVRSNGNAAMAEVVPMPFPNTRLFDISRDRTQWLLGSFRERGEPAALWRVPVPGEAPVRVGMIEAMDALWSTDGQKIFYDLDRALWIAQADGSNPEKVADLPGDADWLAWSPDGSRLRFTVNGQLWEWRAGRGANPLLFSGKPLPRCCGAWSRDGRYFLFSAQQNGIWNLWAQREPVGWARWWGQWLPGLRPQPVRLTNEARSTWGAFTGFGDRQAVFYQADAHVSSQWLDLRSHQLQPLLPGRAAIHVTFSPNGRQVAYLDSRDQTVWTADIGAGQTAANFRRLTLPGAAAAFPRWSPDGQWIAYGSLAPNRHWRAYMVSASGGPPRQIGAASAFPDTDAANPDWSPDGDRLLLSLDRYAADGEHYSLAIVDRAFGRLTAVPGSGGLTAASWSPDGKWLAAYSSDQHRIEVFSFASQRWRVVTTGNAFTDPIWSRDSRYVYVQDLLAAGQPLYRLARGGWQREQVAEFSAELRGGVHRCGFMGLAPDGSPLLALTRSTSNLYAATLDLP